MYRIRFHGRGGQGMKTASRVLGSAFFNQGFEVQDAPRYGAERRGAPIFAYVRACRKPINERGVISHPDLVVVADDSLVSVPSAGVLQGVSAHTTMLINSSDVPEVWQNRLNLAGTVLILPAIEDVADRVDLPFISSVCAGAAARLIGVIGRNALAEAIENEFEPLGRQVMNMNREKALKAFDLLAGHEGAVVEGAQVSARTYKKPEWIGIPFEEARLSAPTIHASATSVKVKTGLWRTIRPVIDYARCNRC